MALVKAHARSKSRKRDSVPQPLTSTLPEFFFRREGFYAGGQEPRDPNAVTPHHKGFGLPVQALVTGPQTGRGVMTPSDIATVDSKFVTIRISKIRELHI